jgi:hypothetical protein
MAQKSNRTTLNPNVNNVNLINVNSKLLFLNFKFLLFFKYLLDIKNILIFDFASLPTHNINFLSINIFFKSKKIAFFKKKSVKLSNKKVFVFEDYKTIKDLFDRVLILNRNNLICFSIKNLNLLTEKKLLIFFYKKLKFFTKLYFQRTFNLFIDFVKACCLLYQGLIKSENFIYFIGSIFKSISKKVHIRFLSFLRDVFKFLLTPSSLPILYLQKKKILGFKFLIGGRLRDKSRASFYCLHEGLIPINKLDSDLDFSKLHVYTILGVFGLKLWIYHK